MESFNPQMEQLSMDFNKVMRKDLNIYAFDEPLPIDDNWVNSHGLNIFIINLYSIVEHFYVGEIVLVY